MSDLAEHFAFTAEWRRQKAEEYPEDSRNIEAAEMLDRLAAELANPEAALLACRLESLWGTADGLKVSETLSERLRAVGFHLWPANAQDFLEDILAELETRRSAA